MIKWQLVVVALIHWQGRMQVSKQNIYVIILKLNSKLNKVFNSVVWQHISQMPLDSIVPAPKNSSKIRSRHKWVHKSVFYLIDRNTLGQKSLSNSQYIGSLINAWGRDRYIPA